MPSKIFCIPLAKFLTTFFSRSPKFFTFFASVVKFHENSFPGSPPVLHHAPVTTFFYFFFGHLPTFLKKTDSLDAPQGGCQGPSPRPHPPLHAAGSNLDHHYNRSLNQSINIHL